MVIRGRRFGHQIPPTRREEEAEYARREYLWNKPDGNNPDFSETYIHGDEIFISWNALNNSIYDLWLTSWDADPDPVALCLARAVNLGHDGNLKLVTSDPPTAELANKTRYVLQFKPPTGQGEFVASDPDISSPAFLLVESTLNQQDVSGATASAPPQASPTRIRTTPSMGIATSAPTPDPEEPISDMSPAAAAGLTVGLILAVALLVALEVSYLMWRRKKRRREAGGNGGTSSSRRRRLKRAGDSDRGLFAEVDKTELVMHDAVWLSPELPGDSTWGQRLVHELQGSKLGIPGRTLTINSSVVELEGGRG